MVHAFAVKHSLYSVLLAFQWNSVVQCDAAKNMHSWFGGVKIAGLDLMTVAQRNNFCVATSPLFSGYHEVELKPETLKFITRC